MRRIALVKNKRNNAFSCTKSILFLSAIALIFYSCNNSQETIKFNHPVPKGDVKYGGVFRQNETEYFRSLYPQNITEVVGHRIITQIYEGLVAFNPADLSLQPCIAKSWEIRDSATFFVFHLRNDVYFHDDPCFPNGGKGRKVTAHDFAFCFQQLCRPNASNQGFWIFQDIVKGSSECYNDSSANGKNHVLEGVNVIDDTTLTIQLNKPFAGFLFRLALPFTAVFPKEAFDFYGKDMREHAVGTGPFRIKKVIPDVGVFLVRNPNYWGKDSLGNQLPYLDGLRFSFIKEEKVEMLEFQKGNIDLKYRLPVDMVTEIIDSADQLQEGYKQFQLQNVRELSSQYYGFLTIDPVYKNVHVRRAFNYAIDRNKIVNYTVKGEGTANTYGITPIGVPGFDQSKLKGYSFNPQLAEKEMELAGYPKGKGFPKLTLHINSGGGRNEKVAEAITTMLHDNLGIEVDIAQSLWAQHTENLESGKFQFWRLGWVADYPDAENFLNLFYGKHVPKNPTDKAYINSFRYQNPTYDKLFEEALATADFAKRNEKYVALDQMIIDDAPVLFIYFNMNRRLLQPYVRNMPANSMEYRSYREVWLNK
ncbi:MAG: ABC transporter substrate-binding protein [Chitinophagales bacterium]